MALTAAATHATTLVGGFVWLDHGDIVDGAAIAPPSAWLDLFFTGFARTGFYRPLVALSLSLDAAISHGPFIFHLQSLLWHALAALLVTVAAESLGLSARAALTGGVLFAVHPVGSLVAGAISYRGDAMAAAALMALIAAHRGERPGLAAAALLLGALAKETALVLGPLFVVVMGRKASRRLLTSEAAALAVALVLRLIFAPSWHASLPALSLSDHLGTRLGSILHSASVMVAPIDRGICDAFPVTSIVSIEALGGLVVAAGIAALAARRKGPALLMALSLLPSLDLVAAPRFWSPHYLYTPLAFAAMLAGDVVARQGRTVLVATVGLCVGFATLSLVDGRRFRDDDTLFGAEARARPECREGHLYLGDARAREGDLAAAAREYRAAAAPVAPGYIAYADEAAALQNLGVVMLRQDRPDDAEQAFQRALTLRMDDLSRRKLVHNLAAIAFARGDSEACAQLLEGETKRPDALSDSLLLRARALYSLGRAEEGELLLARLRARHP